MTLSLGAARHYGPELAKSLGVKELKLIIRQRGLAQVRTDAESAQKLGQLQPFIAVPQECTGRPASLGRPNTLLDVAAGVDHV